LRGPAITWTSSSTPVDLPLCGVLAGVAVGHPVHDRRRLQVKGGVEAVLDLRGRDRGDERHPGLQRRGHVRVGHQFRVGDQEEPLLAGHLLQVLHRPDNLGDLGRATAEDAGVDRDTAVAGDRETV
jgi:hypothetical protein